MMFDVLLIAQVVIGVSVVAAVIFLSFGGHTIPEVLSAAVGAVMIHFFGKGKDRR